MHYVPRVRTFAWLDKC